LQTIEALHNQAKSPTFQNERHSKKKFHLDTINFEVIIKFIYDELKTEGFLDHYFPRYSFLCWYLI